MNEPKLSLLRLTIAVLAIIGALWVAANCMSGPF